MANFKKIVKQYNLNIEYLLKNSIFWITMFIFIFFSQMISIFFIPYQMVSSIKLIFSTSIPILILMGSLLFTWKKSTLEKNRSLTSSNKIIYYAALAISVFVIGNVLSLLMLLFDHLFFELNMQISEWFSFEKVQNLNYGEVNILVLLYILQLNIVLSFSLSYFLSKVIPNIKSYYVFIFIFLLLGLIFGGAFNSYFLVFQNIDRMNGFSNRLEGELVGGFFKPEGMPKEMFIPSLFYPFFAVSTFFQSTFSTVIKDNVAIINRNFYPFLISFKDGFYQWSLILITPYVFIFLFLMVGNNLPKFH